MAIVKGDHKTQDTSVTGDKIQDTVIVLGTKGVKGEDTVDPRDQIQNRGIQRDQIQDTAIDMDQKVKVQGYSGSWGSDTESRGQDLKNWASWVQADTGCRLQNKTERFIFAFIIIISASQNLLLGCPCDSKYWFKTIRPEKILSK